MGTWAGHAQCSWAYIDQISGVNLILKPLPYGSMLIYKWLLLAQKIKISHSLYTTGFHIERFFFFFLQPGAQNRTEVVLKGQ